MAGQVALGFLERLGISLSELEEVIAARPSLRGIIIGYLAERRLCDIFFRDHELHTPDDHDRTQGGDRWVTWKGKKISIEVKSLDTPSVRQNIQSWSGTYQINGSDKRRVLLPNGNPVETNCLVVGGFDILAVSLFEFGQEWRFAFIGNDDLPRSTYSKYSEEDRQYLLKSSNKITWPLASPYESSPFELLDRIAESKSH